MSKVVYRGIEYDTQKRLEYQQQMSDLSTFDGKRFAYHGCNG